jgi:heme-degrading monooxygenase HmoA
MSYVVINAITVPEDNREELERRFAARAGQVSSSPGFEHFTLLRPSNEGAGDKYLVYTRWDSKDSFQAWMSSSAFTQGHKGSEAGSDGASPRPAGTASEVWMYEVIQSEEAPGK